MIVVMMMMVIIVKSPVANDDRRSVRDDSWCIGRCVRWYIRIGRVGGVVGRAITASAVIPSHGLASDTQPRGADGRNKGER